MVATFSFDAFRVDVEQSVLLPRICEKVSWMMGLSCCSKRFLTKRVYILRKNKMKSPFYPNLVSENDFDEIKVYIERNHISRFQFVPID